MKRTHLLTAAAGLGLLSAAPLSAQTATPAAPSVSPPAATVSAPSTAAPATVGPEVREAAVEAEAETKAEAKVDAKPAKPKRATDGSSIRGNLQGLEPKPKKKAKAEVASDAAATAATKAPAAATSADTAVTANPSTTSQGAANASVNGLANASTNSALADAGKPELNAVVGGTAVIGASGTSIGTVTGRVKNRAGATVGLQVKLADGTTTTIPASELTLSGSTLTTSWVARK